MKMKMKEGKSRGVCYQGVEKSSFAYKMMNKLGWSEGRGLGANEQGITSHIRAKKKDDNEGVGVAEAAKAKGDWTVNTSAYDKILSNLRSHHEEGEGGEAATTSGAAAEAKGKRSKGKEKKSKRKLVRAAGRYKKRESAKVVKNYSAEDLAAILGTNSEDVFAQVSQRDCSAAGDDKEGQEEEEPKRKRIVIELELAENKLMKDYKPVKLTSDWWGFKMFTQSTRLLGDQEVKVKGDKSDFTEQDQEDIYTNAKNSVLGKRIGLGMGSREKWEGGKWEGEKKTFDDEEDGSEEEDEGEMSFFFRGESSKKFGVGKKEGDAVSKSKLKDLIVSALKANKKKKMKAKKLKDHVFAQVAENVANVEKFFKVLQSNSSKFGYDGKRVKLT
ncbi:hypothetical protein HOP50_16g77680 [Chloropicon primus]|uniref:G-patch domain-containing protein n=2 Tax=Chloropicon primus TaxID=1764295 RepID=A0A5B8MZV5_9CHLO|nr:hypothetical protein A3770_16p77400 [Chloropicon primus]UPR04427.1 hypothetical protein HOP50_16g77680 [Chloropicon primus]|eukprot:QDZ25222.1 hypothetical protein A3770_16p77400 [Chloropicon primus]